MMPPDASSFCEPCLVMVIEPETKTRFRYESEGGSHGGLTGKKKGNGKKAFPTVKLQNYLGPSEDIFIRVKLYTEQKTEHVLTFKKKKSSGSQNYIDENLNTDFTAEFKNLTILSKKKEEVYEALMERKFQMLGKKPSRNAKDLCERENGETVKKEAKNILNSVILRFDAFERNRPEVQICPPLYSEPICNQKASSRGDLKIHRMSKVSGSWRGGEEVILLCDKVQKDNIKILFYEKDVEDGWKAYASFNPADVHYQVAIPFKTPSYKENTEKEVAVALERQDELSEPRPFTYIPDDYPSKKRKMDFSEKFSPMTISNPGSSSVSDDSLQEAFNNFSTNQVQETESLFSPGKSSNDNFSLNLNDEVANMYGLSLEEMLEKMLESYESPLSDFKEIIQDDLINFIDDCPISASERIQIDVGKLEGQMADVSLEESSIIRRIVNNRKQCYTGQSQPVTCSRSQKENLKKYSHFLSKVDDCGNTLLHLAIIHNKNPRVVIEVNKMANSNIINAQNCNGETALHISVEKNTDMVKDLLLAGSNPNIKNADGNNCYHIACLNDFDTCLKHLLKYSIFPHGINEFNYEGLTPLHIAIKKKSVLCFNILRRNCDIDLEIKDKICDKSLLHYAVEYEPSFIFLILEEAKIDVNIQDSEGNTPLHIACATGDYNTVKQLLLAKANPLIRNFKQNYPDLEEENSGDETSSNQTPADLTTDKKILDLLKQASERDISAFTDSVENSGCETKLNKVCDLLDSDKRWKMVAPYVLDEKYFGSLEWSSSPTRTLLDYMKKESSKEYIENLKKVLEMVDFNDALEIIKEIRQP